MTASGRTCGPLQRGPSPGFKEAAAHNLTSALGAHPHRPPNPRLPFALGAESPMGPPGAISP